MHSGLFAVFIVLLFNVFAVFSQTITEEVHSAEASRETTRYESRTTTTTTTRTRTYTTTSRVNGSSRFNTSYSRPSVTTTSYSRPNNNGITTVRPVNTSTKTLPTELSSTTVLETANNNTQSNNTNTETKSNPFEEFLDKIKFKFTKPEEYAKIYSDSFLNVQWDSDYIVDDSIKISVYLQGLDGNINGVSQGSFIRDSINLNDKFGNFHIGQLNNDLSEYALWLYTNHYGYGLFYQGPILINGNSTNPNLLVKPEVKDEEEVTKTTGGINSKYLLLIIFAIAAILFTGYFINLYVGGRRKRQGEYEDYQDYKSIPQIENDINDKEPEMQKATKDDNIDNPLAEQLQKAEQVYNSKVFKNPDLSNGNIVAPLVDMSSLYKSTQEILKQTKGYTPVETKNPVYDRKLKNKNQNGNRNENESFLNMNNVSQLSMNSTRNKIGSPGSINSNKILSQSTNYSEGSQKNKNDVEETDDDYINKNSFCLNVKDNDAFENYYLNQQNDHFSNNKDSKKHTSPLVATVTTVEEYLAAHRNSINKSKRGSRTSSLINISNSNSNTSSILVGNPHFNVVSKLDKFNQEAGNPKLISNMNESILEELNTLERKIQQQKLIYLKSIQNNQQSIDPNQLKLQKANLHQQGIDSDQLFPTYLMNHASPPVKPKAVIMNSPDNPTSPPSTLKNVNSPPSVATINSKGSKSNGLDNIKSQESEATVAQELSSDNEEEIETKVATHVCKAWYSPNMSDELRMCPGDELIILEKFNDGWGLGQNTEGNVGVFPLDCVTFIDYDRSNNSFENDRNNTENNNQSYSSQDIFFPNKQSSMH